MKATNFISKVILSCQTMEQLQAAKIWVDDIAQSKLGPDFTTSYYVRAELCTLIKNMKVYLEKRQSTPEGFVWPLNTTGAQPAKI